jgi:uncharacterized Tic20 family protein
VRPVIDRHGVNRPHARRFMNSPPLPPVPVESPNDKFLAILCHVSLFLGVGFVLPLIVYLITRGQSELVAAHAREVLNFHISLLIYSICTIPFVFILIGIPIFIALGVMSVICAIVAAVQASEGRFYFYPLTLRFIS